MSGVDRRSTLALMSLPRLSQRRSTTTTVSVSRDTLASRRERRPSERETETGLIRLLLKFPSSVQFYTATHCCPLLLLLLLAERRSLRVTTWNPRNETLNEDEVSPPARLCTTDTSSKSRSRICGPVRR